MEQRLIELQQQRKPLEGNALLPYGCSQAAVDGLEGGPARRF
jgi:hypothetical protein